MCAVWPILKSKTGFFWKTVRNLNQYFDFFHFNLLWYLPLDSAYLYGADVLLPIAEVSNWYWCYDHRNRNRFFNWKSNRIEIVFLVHPVKRFVHWSIGSLIDAVVALQKTDHSLQRVGRYLSYSSVVDGRPRLEWERWGGGRVLIVPRPQTRPTYRYRPIITWHWPGSEHWLSIFLTVRCLLCIYLSICRPDT